MSFSLTHPPTAAKSSRVANARASEKRYRTNNKEKVREARLRWGRKNPDRLKEISQRYRENNPGAIKERNRRQKLRIKFGISIEEYELLLSAQGGVCAICRRSERNRGRKYLTVDHCHRTGAVRGLLCANCNTAIGMLGDEPDLASSAAEYLRR